MKSDNKREKYYDTKWTPPGWNKKEWQIIWKKLWLLSRDELKKLGEELGTKFVDKKIQERLATKADFIEIIDDGVDAQELKEKLDAKLRQKGFSISKKTNAKKLDDLLKKIGAK